MVGIGALAWPVFANHKGDGRAKKGSFVAWILHKANTSSSSYLIVEEKKETMRLVWDDSNRLWWSVAS